MRNTFDKPPTYDCFVHAYPKPTSIKWNYTECHSKEDVDCQHFIFTVIIR